MTERRAKDDFFETFWELATGALEIFGFVAFLIFVAWVFGGFK
jgi:hypothetical protein